MDIFLMFVTKNATANGILYLDFVNVSNVFKFQCVSTSKNKNTDHRLKEICAIMSIKITYKTDHISLLHDSTMQNALNFGFYVFYCYLKDKDHIRRIMISKKKKIKYFFEKSALGLVRPIQQKIKLPSPNYD